MADDGYAGQQTFKDGASEYSQIAFIVNSILGGKATATLVLVKAVTNAGGVEAVGLIDVQPMVAQLDGNGQPTPHGTIHNVPYMRLQGGQNAVIIDPVVGDIGICVFASHDLSSVKANKAPSNPGSRRRFSMSDGLYIGGVLNGSPVRYIQFDADGNVTIKPAATVTVDGDLHVTGDVTSDGDMVANGISATGHKHGGVASGGAETDPPTA